MIVTRQRRKPFPWKRLILPVIAIALATFAFMWTPSRNVIVNGPMAPLWRTTGSTFDTVAKPFHFAAQNQLLTDQNKKIAQLQQQVTDLQSQATTKDKKIGSLNGQVQDLQVQAANAIPCGGGVSPHRKRQRGEGAEGKAPRDGPGARAGACPVIRRSRPLRW